MRLSIVGITGYSGLELFRLLQSHRYVTISSIHASKENGKLLSDLYPHLDELEHMKILPFDSEYIMKHSDLVFFATPSGIAKNLVTDFIKSKFPVIDLSGDHRISPKEYEKWYGKDSNHFQSLFTYGLAEFTNVKDKIFISNPGCYATATELGLIPLLKSQLIELDSIIIDAKSGLSGAGKTPTTQSHFVNMNNNYVTYKLNQHQHIPEIMKFFKSIEPQLPYIQFSTSLLPVNRGLMATIYTKVKPNVTFDKINASYLKFYSQQPFIRLKKRYLPYMMS